MYQSKTIRRMPPLTRKLARTMNQAELAIRKYRQQMLTVFSEMAIRKLNKLVPDIQSIESEVIAWNKRQEHFKSNNKVDHLELWPDDSMLAKVSKERK